MLFPRSICSLSHLQFYPAIITYLCTFVHIRFVPMDVGVSVIAMSQPTGDAEACGERAVDAGEGGVGETLFEAGCEALGDYVVVGDVGNGGGGCAGGERAG